jgi:hypothetical protein
MALPRRGIADALWRSSMPRNPVSWTDEPSDLTPPVLRIRITAQ